MVLTIKALRSVLCIYGPVLKTKLAVLRSDYELHVH